MQESGAACLSSATAFKNLLVGLDSFSVTEPEVARALAMMTRTASNLSSLPAGSSSIWGHSGTSSLAGMGQPEVQQQHHQHQPLSSDKNNGGQVWDVKTFVLVLNSLVCPMASLGVWPCLLSSTHQLKEPEIGLEESVLATRHPRVVCGRLAVTGALGAGFACCLWGTF